MDLNGQKIEGEDVLDFEDGLATVSVSSSAYCYLYFDIFNSLTDKFIALAIVVRNL